MLILWKRRRYEFWLIMRATHSGVDLGGWGVDYGWVSVFLSELVVFELGAGIRCYGSGFLLYVLIYFFHIITLQDFSEREQTEFQFRSTIQTIARKEPNTTTSELGEREGY